MTQFSYRCVDREGEILVGEIEAIDRPAAISELRGRGLIALDLSSEGPTLLMRVSEPVGFLSKPGGRDIYVVLRDLARLLTAGLAIDAAFQLLVNMQKNDMLRRALEDVREKLRSGESLAAAMSDFPAMFPVQVTAAIQAGENSGALPDALATLATNMEKAVSFQERLRSALIYPSILMAMVTGTFVLVLTFVLPQFESLFVGNEDKLPVATRIVMGMGDFFEAYWPLLVLALFGFFAWIMVVRREKNTRRRVLAALCAIPWLKTWLLTPDIVRFVRTLGVCIGAGLALDAALAMAINSVRVPHMEDELLRVRREVRRGDLLSTALGRLDWFPPLALQFVLVGEQSGQLGEMLGEAATIMAQDFETRLEKGLGVISPLLTLLMGAVVALLIGAVLLGIMSINDVVF